VRVIGFRRLRPRGSGLQPRRGLRPRWTLRLRLTLLYGALFLAAGAVLLTITYELVAHSQAAKGGIALRAKGPPGSQAQVYFTRPDQPLPAPKLPPGLPAPLEQTARQLQAQATVQIANARQSQLNALLTRSGIALGIMAIVSIGLGWLMAGRALRPVRTMSERARGISERNLHERLAVDGPDDELKELGDTFDALLARLESAFESQRRFVANASHELRTPITLERTLVEVALADPESDVESLRTTCRRVLAAGEQQERLIEALLTLARSQRGVTCQQDVDLADLAREAIRGRDTDQVMVEADLAQAPVTGDPALLERLVGNLVDNALRYNRPGGDVLVRTGTEQGESMLQVSNTGPVVPADQVQGLLEPFRRLDSERTGKPDGLGLGLSIVAAIADVHGAALRPQARPDGGLDVRLRFTPSASDAVAVHPAPDLVTLPTRWHAVQGQHSTPPPPGPNAVRGQ
jgi:signal transduction histidine kinase